MTIGCPVVEEPFSVQPFCHSWILARFTKDKMHICTFLVCSSLHGTTLFHFHIQTEVTSLRIIRISFFVAEYPPGIRKHDRPQLIRSLPSQTSTILTNTFLTGNISARATYKFQVVASQYRDLSGTMCIYGFSSVWSYNISSKLWKATLKHPVYFRCRFASTYTVRSPALRARK
jgi:hypothetical protein